MHATEVSPERARALEYLTVRAEGMSAREIWARVRAAVVDVDAALQGVDAQAARAAVPAGQWNIAQVVDHVAQTTIRVAEELRHLLEGRRPPGPPVYDALTSGAAQWAPWPDLQEGLRSANAEVDALLGRAMEREPSTAVTARTILVFNRTRPDGGVEPETFEVELHWKGYAMVQRLHLLDHRTQIRALRTEGERRS
ncbi:MAG: DinB family protein [Candidatus Rokuibacteriota bacterium]